MTFLSSSCCALSPSSMRLSISLCAPDGTAPAGCVLLLLKQTPMPPLAQPHARSESEDSKGGRCEGEGETENRTIRYGDAHENTLSSDGGSNEQVLYPQPLLDARSACKRR